ncbi:MAG: glycosyltransferase family 2 protein [Limisphaerales bacterium]
MKSVTGHGPLVSIVTPSFNQAAYLEATLRSVLEQTYAPIEYIVMDGGSRDGSAELLQRYAPRLAHWQSGPDGGFGDAIAQGFARSHGEILAYLNSDDLLAPDAVERAVGALSEDPSAVLAYGHRACIDGSGRLLYLRPSMPCLARSPYAALIIPQETCFWRRSAYLAAGGMNAGLRFAIDYDLFSRLSHQGEFHRVPGLWGFFRKHCGSKTMTSYHDVGIAEGRRIQREQWGGEVPVWRWRLVQLMMRGYGLAASTWLARPTWPASLPPAATLPLRQRILGSLHETHPVKRWLKMARRKPGGGN